MALELPDVRLEGAVVAGQVVYYSHMDGNTRGCM